MIIEFSSPFTDSKKRNEEIRQKYLKPKKEKKKKYFTEYTNQINLCLCSLDRVANQRNNKYKLTSVDCFFFFFS